MRISIVAALHAGTRGIGLKGELPWNIYSDRKHFYDMTYGKVVVMGRATYESLPPRERPLRDRANLVLTRQDNFLYCERENVIGVFSIEDLQQEASRFLPEGKKPHEQELVVIGGQEVFELFLPMAHTLYLTLITGDVPVCDRFFPPYEEDFTFQSQLGMTGKCADLEYCFTTWKRRKAV